MIAENLRVRHYSTVSIARKIPLQMKTEPEDFDVLVMQLLKQPGLQYIREMSKILERDPDYLQFHSASVTIRVRQILANDEPRTPGPTVNETTVPKIIREAVVRLRSFEK